MSEQSNKPTEPIDNADKLEYRVLCNSEHFLVLSPRRPMKKREGEKEPRKKGRLLVKK